MPLTDTQIRAFKPEDKPRRYADEKGLYLEVAPSGGKWWRFKYRFGGKEKRLSLGIYPDVTLKQARDRRDEARKLIGGKVDPGAQRKAEKAALIAESEHSFRAVALEWYARQATILADSTKDKLLRRLEVDVLPYLGDRPIAVIQAPDLLQVIKRIEGRGAVDIARRMHNACGRIFRFAVAHGMCARDPSRDIELKDVLHPTQVKHHSSITDPREVGALLRAIDGFSGSFATRCALQLAPLVFVRPGELRHAEWTEIDFEEAEWRIPASKMKMGEQHIVPLSHRAIAILQEIRPLTGSKRYVFPSERGGGRPMSENTVNAALRRLGYTKEEMTGHGFRSLASTLLHEMGYEHQVIERQLAHGERNKVSAAYNFAEHLPDRRRMMQEWADHLDRLKAGAKVLSINQAA